MPRRLRHPGGDPPPLAVDQRLRVADRGLREGILVEMMSEDGVRRRPARRRRALVHEEAASPSGPGGRELTVRVKTARGRKASSTRWLERQLERSLCRRAPSARATAARAAYKLIEIDDTLSACSRRACGWSISAPRREAGRRWRSSG